MAVQGGVGGGPGGSHENGVIVRVFGDGSGSQGPGATELEAQFGIIRSWNCVPTCGREK